MPDHPDPAKQALISAAEQKPAKPEQGPPKGQDPQWMREQDDDGDEAA